MPSESTRDRFVEERLGWFMSKHQLTEVRNDLRDRILVALFNGDVVTVASPSVDLKVIVHRRSFGIQARSASSRSWRGLKSIFTSEELAQGAGETLQETLEFIDQNWPRLVEALSGRQGG